MFAYTAELMDRAERSDGGVVADFHMTGQSGSVCEDGLRSHMTVVGDMGVSHEEIAGSDLGDPSSPRGTTIHGYEFAKGVAVADAKLGLLTAEFQILRGAAQRNLTDDAVVATDRGRALDAGEGPMMQPGPIRTSGPMTTNGPTSTPAAISAALSTTAES